MASLKAKPWKLQRPKHHRICWPRSSQPLFKKILHQAAVT